MLTAILFAVLTLINPATDIPYRLQMLGPSATYTNTEQMFSANPTAYGLTEVDGVVIESPQTAQEPQQDDPGDLSYRVYLPSANMAKPAQKITEDGIRNAMGAGFSYLEWMTGELGRIPADGGRA
jgi:hypothetical protein